MNQFIERKKSRYAILYILIIYVVCFIFRGIEYFIIRTDQTAIGEAFIHKIIGIGILILSMRALGYKCKDIGFNKTVFVRFTLWGLLLGLSTFFIAYLSEYLVQYFQQNNPNLDYFVTSYSIDGNRIMSTSILFVLICIAGNIINVIMEEGIFRGLFIHIGEERYTYTKSMLIAASCFGFWHIAQSARSFIDGDITLNIAIFSALGYALMTFVMGIKFGLLVKATGSLWASMADHFVNNTIVNLLHITTSGGVDEYQFIRISVAQTLSFIIVLIFYLKSKAHTKPTFR